MITKVTHATIWVKDQDEALKFYRDKLGFKVVSDDSISMPNYRWLTVAPQQQTNLEIALNLATTPEQLAGVGKQGIFILASTDVKADLAALRAKGSRFKASCTSILGAATSSSKISMATISMLSSRPNSKNNQRRMGER